MSYKGKSCTKKLTLHTQFTYAGKSWDLMFLVSVAYLVLLDKEVAMKRQLFLGLLVLILLSCMIGCTEETPAPVYEITFEVGAGTAPDPTAMSVTYGQAYGALPTTTRTDYVFAGWWTESGGTGIQITADSQVHLTASQALYAKWALLVQTVTYDVGEGTALDPATKSVTYNQAYGNLPIPSRASYAFIGWWSGLGGTGTHMQKDSLVTSTTDHALYAKWMLIFDGPAGGKVFYENPNYATEAWRYLEAAPSTSWFVDGHDPLFDWGIYNYDIAPPATATAIGTGKSNTENIVAYHDSLGDYYSNPTKYGSTNKGTVAAKVCADYSVTNASVLYDDWFLPSKAELDLMYHTLKLQALGGFSSNIYWSSSEYFATDAWTQFFSDGVQTGFTRDGAHMLRAIRAYK